MQNLQKWGRNCRLLTVNIKWAKINEWIILEARNSQSALSEQPSETLTRVIITYKSLNVTRIFSAYLMK